MKLLKTLFARLSETLSPSFRVDSRTRLIYALTLLSLLPIGIASAQDNMNSTRSSGSDYSSALNKYGGFHNYPVYPNQGAFSALKNDGSITVWGNNTNLIL